MAAVPIGLAVLWRMKYRGPALVAAGTGIYYLLLNASYFYWEGGLGIRPTSDHRGAPVPRAGPCAALGSRTHRRPRPAAGRMDLGRRRDAHRRVDDAAAARVVQGADARAAVAGVS